MDYYERVKEANSKIDEMILKNNITKISIVCLQIGSEFGMGKRFVMERLEHLKLGNYIRFDAFMDEIKKVE